MITLNRNKVREQIEGRVRDDISSGRVGGVACLVKQGGETVYRGFFGSADGKREITENTVFRLASMTKPITGVAIMKQVEKGLVSLDDTLDRFIPEYSEMEIGRIVDGKIQSVGKAKNKIKILHLLTHSSGVVCGALNEALERMRVAEREYDLESVAREYSSKPLAFEPYSGQAYSGRVGFDLLARVVEITSGMSYDAFLKKELFTPLGMTDTTFVPTNEQWDRTVCMHDLRDGKPIFLQQDREHIFGKLPLTYFCGGAGLVSTLADYEKFADMLLSDGVAKNGECVLCENSVRRMSTVSVPDSVMAGNQRWGLSMRVISDPSYAVLPVGAYGWSGAFGTHFWIDPENRVVGIYMKNSHYDGGSGAVTAANFEKDVYL